MREIRFRAWNGRAMEYGGFSIHATGRVLADCEGLSSVNMDHPVMQYTGLEDKNGVEIYEGDIISHVENCLTMLGEKKTAVTFESGTFRTCSVPIHVVVDSFYPVVIGNIYENPELLED